MSYISKWVDRVAVESGLDMSDNNEAMLAVLYALLAKTKESAVTSEDVHDAWSLWTQYIKGNEEHKSLIPFDELNLDVQAMDLPYVEAIFRTQHGMRNE